jgi:tetratricopeptide (TPR) repeat protein
VIVWGIIKNQAWAFLGVCFFIILSPSSSFVPVNNENINEYRMYLALLAPATLLVLGIYRLNLYFLTKHVYGNFQHEKIITTINSLLLMVILGAVAMSLSLLTHHRNIDYKDHFSIWLDTVEKAPKNARAQVNLATTYAAKKEIDQAIFHVKEAIKLDSSSADAHYNLGAFLDLKGNCKDAIGEYKKSIELHRDYYDARTDLGVCLFKEGNIKDAIDEFRIAHNMNSSNGAISNNLQVSLTNWSAQLINSGQKSSAVAPLTEALSLNPNNADAKRLLVIANGK